MKKTIGLVTLFCNIAEKKLALSSAKNYLDVIMAESDLIVATSELCKENSMNDRDGRTFITPGHRSVVIDEFKSIMYDLKRDISSVRTSIQNLAEQVTPENIILLNIFSKDFCKDVTRANRDVKNNPIAHAKAIVSVVQRISCSLCSIKTWQSYELTESFSPMFLRSEFFTSIAKALARIQIGTLESNISILRQDITSIVTIDPISVQVTESNLSKGNRLEILKAIKMQSPEQFKLHADMPYEFNTLDDLARSYSNLADLKAKDDQIVRWSTNIAKCMGLGIMHDLVANHVSTLHPITRSSAHLFCKSGSGTSFADAIAFNFYKPGPEFRNTFVHTEDEEEVHRFGSNVNSEIVSVISSFVQRKMLTLGFTGARVDCVRNIPSEIRQSIYKEMVKCSNPSSIHIMEELLFCGNPDVEIPKWKPDTAPIANTVTGISFFKERMWDGQVHEDVLKDAAMKRSGVQTGIINTVSNHDHNTAFTRVLERISLDLLSHPKSNNSIGTILQMLIGGESFESLSSQGLLRGCNPDGLKSLYDKLHPSAISEDEALQDRVISLLTFSQCSAIVAAMRADKLSTQSFVLKRLLNHIYTNAFSGSGGYYYVHGDHAANLVPPSIFVRDSMAPIQSSISLRVFDSNPKRLDRPLIKYIKELANRFVDSHVERLLDKSLVNYDPKKTRDLRARNEEELKDISYRDILDIIDADGKESLINTLKHFVINSINASAEHLLKTSANPSDVILSKSSSIVNQADIFSMYNFIYKRFYEVYTPELLRTSSLSSIILRKSFAGNENNSVQIANLLDAYNIFPSINNILRDYSDISSNPTLHSFQLNDNIVAFLRFSGPIPNSPLEIILCNLNPGVTYTIDATDMKHLAVWLQRRYFAERYKSSNWEEFAREHIHSQEFTDVFNAIMSPLSLPGSADKKVKVHLAPGVNQGFVQDGYTFTKHNFNIKRLVLISNASKYAAPFFQALEIISKTPMLEPNGLTEARETLLGEDDLAQKLAKSPCLEISVLNPRDIDVIDEIESTKYAQQYLYHNAKYELIQTPYVLERYLSDASNLHRICSIKYDGDDFNIDRIISEREDSETQRMRGQYILHELRSMTGDRTIPIFSLSNKMSDVISDIDRKFSYKFGC